MNSLPWSLLWQKIAVACCKLHVLSFVLAPVQMKFERRGSASWDRPRTKELGPWFQRQWLLEFQLRNKNRQMHRTWMRLELAWMSEVNSECIGMVCIDALELRVKKWHKAWLQTCVLGFLNYVPPEYASRRFHSNLFILSFFSFLWSLECVFSVCLCIYFFVKSFYVSSFAPAPVPLKTKWKENHSSAS